MRVPLDESHVGDGVGGVLEAAALEDAGEAVAEVEVGGRDGAAQGELEEGVVALIPLPLVVVEGAADPEGAAAAVVDEVSVPVSPASWSNLPHPFYPFGNFEFSKQHTSFEINISTRSCTARGTSV